MIDHNKLTRDFIVNVMMYCVNRTVWAFENVADAFFHLENKGCLDLIIVEARMPNKSGFDLIKRVKAQTPQTLLVVTSSHPEDEIQAVNLGVDAFLAKPFILQDLFDLVQHFVFEGNCKP